MTMLSYARSSSTKRLSSIWTVYWKFVFPALWIIAFGVANIAIWVGGFTGRNGEPPVPSMKILFFVGWVVGSGFIIWFARRLRYVAVCDNRLVVSNYFRQTRLPISS